MNVNVAVLPRRWSTWLSTMNTTGHRWALIIFMVIVLSHWAEHLVQAFQIWALGWADPDARGVLGLWFPSLVSSEALHYGYALAMLAGIMLLRPGFVGQARTWWTAALVIQVWHHVEHLLLLAQAHLGFTISGHNGSKPSSILQMVFPRVELHLFYNAAVFIPMVIAMVLHRWPRPEERLAASCTCAVAQA